ncbi:uncharacterized protein K02A2.6-like [Toxorhynchites rutilus septentrionalis]|uniref:uncharacterized protein K02A2.6-like n=1 Tax=Toxorhynchites rutilus septentrionalis TaxID=329112 RepID=UPI0024783B48|nr:uncharacterized protein K02A2.6-like [Toxorhynchites rutilus septentrionalis]
MVLTRSNLTPCSLYSKIIDESLRENDITEHFDGFKSILLVEHHSAKMLSCCCKISASPMQFTGRNNLKSSAYESLRHFKLEFISLRYGKNSELGVKPCQKWIVETKTLKHNLSGHLSAGAGRQTPIVFPPHPGIHQNPLPQHFTSLPPPQQTPQQAHTSTEVTYAQLIQQLMRQQQEFMQHQHHLLQQTISKIKVQVPPNPETILDSLANNIKEFRYEPESNIIFSAWYARYEDLFEKDAARLDDLAKVRLLMRKLGAAEHERYISFILPKLPKQFQFSETVSKLKSLFKERNDVTLEQLSADCQRLLSLKRDTAMIETSTPSVQFVKQSNRNQQKRNFGRGKQQRNKNIPASPCWFCGEIHYTRDCSYRSHKCNDWGNIGHREGYCSSLRKTTKAAPTNRKFRRSSYTTKTVSLLVNAVNKKRRFVQAQINGVDVRLQLDTGSDISVISKRMWEKIGRPPTMLATEKAATASGDALKLLFKFICTISINGEHRESQIYVVDKSLHLLGIDILDAFGLWSVPISNYCNHIVSPATTVESLKVEYPAVFRSELGVCTKTKIKLELKEGAVPDFRPKRPVAYSTYNAVDSELDRLERERIITPVDFFNWAAPIVVVRKANGTIRICGDYSTGLNNSLQPHRYPLPLPEDIFAKLSSCTIFSQIDLSDAFLQVEIDGDSRDLLTINTHRGLYRYNRLPPGVKTAPGAFQQLIDTMLAGLPCTSGYLDDVVVGGKTAEDHLAHLHAVFQRIQDFGFTIRLEKCTFAQCQIKYLGYLLDQNGLRPDPSKIQVITDMPPPTDVKGVRSFLGAINYFGKFVPSMRSLRFPLDELLKVEKKFSWTPEYLLLTHYNPNLDIIVSADASSVGIGATISHRFPNGALKVVQHASRALTPAEKNYSQPDHEGLAIIFAVTRFHKMIFGRRFLLQTDHAPLLRIFGSKKGIPVYTSNRLQRWALTLLLYDFTIEHIRTEKFGNADVLSRLIRQHVKPEEDYVIATIAFESDVRIVQNATQSDPTTKKVYRYLHDGWPTVNPTEPELKRFFYRKDSLTTVDGCIMYGERLVIPSMYRKRCLDQLHRGHPGIQRMKAITRSYVYWPSLDDDIIGYVKSCHHCATSAKTPPRSAPLSWPKSSKPWERVHMDYAGPIDGEYFLIVVDSYSKWPEMIQTRSTTTEATVGILNDVFARMGMPKTLVSDNGPQFTSAKFQAYCAENGIEHLTTAPFHPQSNGQAERFVDTFKENPGGERHHKGSTQHLSACLSKHCQSVRPRLQITC